MCSASLRSGPELEAAPRLREERRCARALRSTASRIPALVPRAPPSLASSAFDRSASSSASRASSQRPLARAPPCRSSWPKRHAIHASSSTQPGPRAVSSSAPARCRGGASSRPPRSGAPRDAAHPRDHLDGARVGARGLARRAGLLRRPRPPRAAAEAPRRRATCAAPGRPPTAAPRRDPPARRPASPPARTAPARGPIAPRRAATAAASRLAARAAPACSGRGSRAPPPALGGRRPARRARGTARRRGRGSPRRRAREASRARRGAARRRRRRGSGGGGSRTARGRSRGAPAPAPSARERASASADGLAQQVVERLLEEVRARAPTACWSARFSAGGSRSSRAAIAAWTVSGRLFGRALPALDDRLGHLLGEERVAAGRLGDASGERAVLRRAAARSPARRSPPRVSGRSSIWVTLRAARPKSGRRSRSSGRLVHSTTSGTSSEPEDHLLDQVEQAVVGPVRVVDPDHQRPLARQQRDQAPPRPLAASSSTSPSRASPPSAVASDWASSSRVLGAEPRPAVAERVVHASRPSPRRRRPAAARRISPSAQNAIPRPYGGFRPRRISGAGSVRRGAR